MDTHLSCRKESGSTLKNEKCDITIKQTVKPLDTIPCSKQKHCRIFCETSPFDEITIWYYPRKKCICKTQLFGLNFFGCSRMSNPYPQSAKKSDQRKFSQNKEKCLRSLYCLDNEIKMTVDSIISHVKLNKCVEGIERHHRKPAIEQQRSVPLEGGITVKWPSIIWKSLRNISPVVRLTNKAPLNNVSLILNETQQHSSTPFSRSNHHC